MDPGRGRSISVGDRIRVQEIAQILQRNEALCGITESGGQLRGTVKTGGPFGVCLGCVEYGQRFRGLCRQPSDGTGPIAEGMDKAGVPGRERAEKSGKTAARFHTA